MRKTPALWMIALTTLLGACASPPPVIVRPNLPDPPKELTKIVPLADPKAYRTKSEFGLANRLTTIKSNQKVLRWNDFYRDVQDGYGNVR